MLIFSQGVLRKEEFQDCLATFFSMVTPDEMEGLMKSAENELGEFEDGEVPFRDLFTEVREARGTLQEKVRCLCYIILPEGGLE